MAVLNKMATVQVLPLANYANGTRNFGPVDIASNVTSIDFSIARCTTANPTTWPNVSTTVEIIPEISLDNEVTWIECGRFKSNGGISPAKGGGEAQFSIGGGYIPPQIGGITRRFRGTSIVAQGPCRTSMTVEVN